MAVVQAAAVRADRGAEAIAERRLGGRPACERCGTMDSMRAIRPAVVLALLAVIGLGLGAWSVYEARRQRQEIEEALAGEARLLARSLGPGLAAASSSLRELDELVTWRLLDNARLLAELLDAGALSTPRLERLADENDLDAVVVTGSRGELLFATGDTVPAEDLDRLGEITARGADEIILGPRVTAGVEHVAAAVRTASGGALLVRVHASSARTFGRQLGVENLLDSLVESGQRALPQLQRGARGHRPRGLVGRRAGAGGPRGGLGAADGPRPQRLRGRRPRRFAGRNPFQPACRPGRRAAEPRGHLGDATDAAGRDRAHRLRPGIGRFRHRQPPAYRRTRGGRDPSSRGGGSADDAANAWPRRGR